MAINAIDLLKEDHKKVNGLLSQLMDTTSRAKKSRLELLQEIADELRVHTQLEEQVFYPAFKEAGKKEETDMYFEAKEEHKALEETVIPDLENTEVDSEAFAGRAKVLSEMVKHHVQEEEKEMFVKARKLLTDAQLQELGEKMLELKKKLTN